MTPLPRSSEWSVACEMDGLATRLAELEPASERGTWQRHVATRYLASALTGRQADGRWGTKTGFPVLYLGRPTASVVVGAYRHLVDPIEFDSTADRDSSWPCSDREPW